MPRTDTGSYTPEALLTIVKALETIAGRLTKTADAMKEKGVSSLEIKGQSGLKTGISTLRSFGMAAEEAFEEWAFDQNVFKEAAEAASRPERPRSDASGRKSRKQPDTKPTDADTD